MKQIVYYDNERVEMDIPDKPKRNFKSFIKHCKVWNYYRKTYAKDSISDCLHILHVFFKPKCSPGYIWLDATWDIDPYLKERRNEDEH